MRNPIVIRLDLELQEGVMLGLLEKSENATSVREMDYYKAMVRGTEKTVLKLREELKQAL